MLRKIIKCKLFKKHTMAYTKGYGYRCEVCGKPMHLCKQVIR